MCAYPEDVTDFLLLRPHRGAIIRRRLAESLSLTR